MADLEQELRQRTDVDNLINKKVETTEEGRELIEKINRFMGELINEVRNMDDVTNAISDAYNNVRYDLKTARHNIQYQMMGIIKAKHRH